MPGGSWRSGESSYTARTDGGSDPDQQYLGERVPVSGWGEKVALYKPLGKSKQVVRVFQSSGMIASEGGMAPATTISSTLEVVFRSWACAE